MASEGGTEPLTPSALDQSGWPSQPLDQAQRLPARWWPVPSGFTQYSDALF